MEEETKTWGAKEGSYTPLYLNVDSLRTFVWGPVECSFLFCHLTNLYVFKRVKNHSERMGKISGLFHYRGRITCMVNEIMTPLSAKK